MKPFRAFIAFAFSIIFSSAHASTVSLSTSGQSGASLSVDLYMNFSDAPTLGGGLDVHYDGSLLNFISFSFNPTFLSVTDPLLTCPGAIGCDQIDQPNTVYDISFGNFAGIGGPFLVGTLVFNVIGTGSAALLTAETTGLAGPFVSATTYVAQPVSYLGTAADVSAVPVPAALWLMVSGLSLLGLASNRRYH